MKAHLDTKFILMADLFSDFTLVTIKKKQNGNRQFFYTLGSETIWCLLWAIHELHFNRYRSTVDTIEDRQLYNKLGLNWRYPNIPMVMSPTPTIEQIFSDLEHLKTITVDTPLETLFTKTVFSSTPKVNKNTKLAPFQLVLGQQPVLPTKQENSATYISNNIK